MSVHTYIHGRGMRKKKEEEAEKKKKSKLYSQSHLDYKAFLLGASGYSQSLVLRASHTLTWKLSYRLEQGQRTYKPGRFL